MSGQTHFVTLYLRVSFSIEAKHVLHAGQSLMKMEGGFECFSVTTNRLVSIYAARDGDRHRHVLSILFLWHKSLL